jgi:hypothetical protein
MIEWKYSLYVSSVAREIVAAFIVFFNCGMTRVTGITNCMVRIIGSEANLFGGVSGGIHVSFYVAGH